MSDGRWSVSHAAISFGCRLRESSPRGYKLSELSGMRADGERQAPRSDRESSLSSKSSSTRADLSASASTRPIKGLLRTDSTVSRYVISPVARKKKERRKNQKKAEGTFPPFIPTSDLTNEAIARLKRCEPSLSRFDVSSALTLRIIKKKTLTINKSKLKTER